MIHFSGRGEETVTHINREDPKVIRSANDTKRRFAATQHFGRFRSKADIDLLCRQNFVNFTRNIYPLSPPKGGMSSL